MALPPAVPPGGMRVVAATNASDQDVAEFDAPGSVIVVWTDSYLRALAAALATTYAGALTITQPNQNQIWQRETRTGGVFNLGVGDVTIEVTASEPLSVLSYRVFDEADTAEPLTDWATASPPLAAGAHDITVSVPAGLYKALIEYRANSDPNSVVRTTNSVMVGEVRAFAGQSLAQEFIDTRPSGDATNFHTLGLAVSPWAWIWAATALNSGAVPQVPDFGLINYPVTSWIQSSTTGLWKSAFAVQYQNQMIDLTGVPCGLVGFAVGGTGIATWLPGYAGGGTAHYETLVEIITGAGGRFGGFLWDQGHYEARMLTAALTTTTEYRAQLDLLFASLAESFPGSGSFYQLVSSIPAIGNYSSTSVTTRNQVRLVNKQYVAATARSAYIDGLDIELVADLVHYSQAGAITFANEWFRADAKKMGLATYGNAGPLITSATRTYGSANIVLAVTQTNGGTAWVTSGAIENQFTVYPSGTLTGALTVSSVTVSSPSSLTVVLSGAPTEPAALDVWYRITPDDATLVATTIRDNVTGDSIATGRQLALLGTPTTAPIPAANITVDAIPSDTAGTLIAVSGTYTNTILAAGLEYSSDKGGTWTAASSPTIGAGVYSFSIAAGLPVGVYQLWVRDPLSFGYGASATFEMAQAAPATLPTITSPIFGFTAANGLATLWSDAARTVQAVVGDAVLGVTDVTGTGNHFSQTTAANAPHYRADVKNGLPGLYFDDSLFNVLNLISGGTLGATLKASTGYAMLLVFTPANAGVNYTVFAAAEQAKSGGFNIIRGAQGLSTNAIRASRNSDTVYYQPSVAGATAANQLAKVVNRYDSSGPSLAEAVNAITEATAVPGALGVNPFTAVTIGAEGSNSITQFYLKGWVHEIRIWDSVASDTQRDDLLTYATSQWGS